jgi:hypothetical protein
MWGVVRYGMKRTYQNNARALALEAGSTMHSVFAGIRLWQLAHIQKLPDHAMFHAQRIFGPEKLEVLMNKDIFNLKNDTDPREQLVEMSFDLIHMSGYYDDPKDNVRTLTNMESAAINYVDEYLPLMENWHVYVEDKRIPSSTIGIELATDAILTYSDGTSIRYIGTADAVLESLLRGGNDRGLYVGENKTASRLDDSWRMAFEMSHQVTGYNAIISARLGRPVYQSKIFGLRLQPGQQDTYESFEPQIRTPTMIQVWARWVYEGVKLYDRYGEDFEKAQRLTHSCNRYFRPCALLTFCADTPEGRISQMADMIEGDMSPSEQAIALGLGV